MCLHLNEGQTHPLELRVHQLENLLEEAITIIASKNRPGDGCVLGMWIDEAIAVLHGD